MITRTLPITTQPVRPIMQPMRNANPGIVPPWLTTPTTTPFIPEPGGIELARALPIDVYEPTPIPITDDPNVPRIW